MNNTLAPHLTPTIINAILAKTVANASPDELRTVQDALARVSGGDASPTTATVTSLLP